MKELYYHYVKIKEGEPSYQEGELRYHYVKIKDNIDDCVGDYCSICKKQDHNYLNNKKDRKD